MSRQLVFAVLILCSVVGLYALFANGDLGAKSGQTSGSLSIITDWVGRYPTYDRKGEFLPPGKSLWEQPGVLAEITQVIGERRFKVLSRDFTVESPIETNGSWVYVDVAKEHELTLNEAQIFINPGTGEIDVCWTETDHPAKSPTKNTWFGNRHPPFMLNDSGCEAKPADQPFQLIEKYQSLDESQMSSTASSAERPVGQALTDYRKKVGECAYNYLFNTGKVTLRCGGAMQHSVVVESAETNGLIQGRDFQDDCVKVASYIHGLMENIDCLGH